MSLVGRIYRALSLVSLDIVAGAVISMLFFSRFFGTTAGWHETLGLAITVWVIYTTDHLMDAGRFSTSADTPRHRFHQMHFKLMTVVVALALAVDVFVVSLLGGQLMLAGLVLIGLVALYLALQHRMGPFRDLTVALLYGTGVLLPALPHLGGELTWPGSVIIVQFYLTVIFNVLLLSYFDQQVDIGYGKRSFSTTFGGEVTRNVLILTSAIHLACIVCIALTDSGRLAGSATIGIMNLGLVFILWRKRFFTMHERFRLFGDAVFLFPLAYLMLLS